jgi:hypothetical protein
MSNTEPNDAKVSEVTKFPKKKYSPPKLTEYGTVREITNTQGRTNADDGGSIVNMTKTNL